MLKKALLSVVLFPAVVFASAHKEPIVNLSPVDIDKTYVCQKYNDNRIDQNGEYVGEDSGVLLLRQEIKQDNLSFSILPNQLFKEGVTMENPVGGSVTGMVGNRTAVFFKQNDDDGATYFVMYMTGESGSFERVIVIADCAKGQK